MRALAVVIALAACGDGSTKSSTKSEGSGSAPVAPDAAPQPSVAIDAPPAAAAPTRPSVAIDAPPAAAAPKLSAADHRVFQCAHGSGDKKLVDKFLVKHGLADASGAPNAAYKPFVEEHGAWVRANIGGLAELGDERKARACAEAALK